MDIGNAPYGILFQCVITSHLGNKLLLPGLLDNMLYKLDMKNHRKITAEPAKTRCDIPSGFLLHESLPDILQDTEESD